MSDSNGGDLAEKLQRLVETVDIANVLTEPLKASIARLLQVSASEMNSDEASVLIRDGDEGDLRFLSAIGKVAGQLIDMRVPAGKGIAGFVMSSGQPVAVADVEADESFYSEVDKTTGYSTQMILATPLTHNGQTIGVVEYINRCGTPPFEPFTPAEMDKAAHFGEAIASLVNAYESAKLFRDLGERGLAPGNTDDLTAVRTWLAEVRGSEEHRQMMDLAVLVRDLASRGDAEREMCRELLEAVIRFSDSKSETSFLSM